MQIISFSEKYIDEVVSLMKEFDNYLTSLGDDRWDFSFENTKKKILKFAFGNEKSFDGYIAKLDDKIVGYALYHYGFDPDEMQGKVIYLIDFFVSKEARGRGIGKALIQKLQSHSDSLGLYFCVWRKNQQAIEFYQKIGAEFCNSTPYMRLLK